jgi:hypothetical protein
VTLKQTKNKQHHNNKQHIKRERERERGWKLAEDDLSDVVGGPEDIGFKLTFE